MSATDRRPTNASNVTTQWPKSVAGVHRAVADRRERLHAEEERVLERASRARLRSIPVRPGRAPRRSRSATRKVNATSAKNCHHGHDEEPVVDVVEEARVLPANDDPNGCPECFGSRIFSAWVGARRVTCGAIAYARARAQCTAACCWRLICMCRCGCCICCGHLAARSWRRRRHVEELDVEHERSVRRPRTLGLAGSS